MNLTLFNFCFSLANHPLLRWFHSPPANIGHAGADVRGWQNWWCYLVPLTFCKASPWGLKTKIRCSTPPRARDAPFWGKKNLSFSDFDLGFCCEPGEAVGIVFLSLRLWVDVIPQVLPGHCIPKTKKTGFGQLTLRHASWAKRKVSRTLWLC